MQQKSPAERRNNDLARIHVAKKELRLDDQAYRDVLEACGGVRSAKDLDLAGRLRVLDQFKKMGWVPKPAPDAPPREAAKPTRQRKSEPGSQDAKILALWLELKRAGKLREPTDKALDAYCKRMTGVDRREWLTAKQSNIVIEGLKQWLAR
jgi:phage gp16-like protein